MLVDAMEWSGNEGIRNIADLHEEIQHVWTVVKEISERLKKETESEFDLLLFLLLLCLRFNEMDFYCAE